MSEAAENYAKALESCFGKGREEAFFSFLKDLRALAGLLDLREVKRFFLSPALSPETKILVLKKTLKDFECDPLIRPFLFLLLKKKRWAVLNAVLKRLSDREEDIKGLQRVELQSACALLPALKEELIRKLEKFFRKKILLKEKPAAPDLMGGIKIRAKGLVFDDTLSFHLKRIENQIRRNVYERTA